ncbi:hypothetical protein KIN20_036235 [Parelaphostrongylus tenuis]|uniref:RRM domain-containing protein n=1 Tax=Parelaphostrongylus tenuis TaxID=148309 RepID=A0AAD5RFU1_PARTN|nr:hypothetical protein KIN20_036235 [Parelaphostrongylus tenuis]
MVGSPTRYSVYVGNIPHQTTEDAIGRHFSQAGRVTNVKIVYDRETGRSKGFGFCEFSDEAGAQNAVNGLMEQISMVARFVSIGQIRTDLGRHIVVIYLTVFCIKFPIYCYSPYKNHMNHLI